MGITFFPPWLLTLARDRALYRYFPTFLGLPAPHASNPLRPFGVVSCLTELCPALASQDDDHPGTASRNKRGSGLTGRGIPGVCDNVRVLDPKG